MFLVLDGPFPEFVIGGSDEALEVCVYDEKDSVCFLELFKESVLVMLVRVHVPLVVVVLTKL